jgi:hypothetical protein
VQLERDAADSEEAESQGAEQEALEGERDWFMWTGPTPGPGDSDGGGSD